MAPRRLLVVSDEMEIGGSQRQISLLLRGLDRDRWQPELVFFRNPSFLVDELVNAGVPVHHVAKRGRIDPGFMWRFAGLLRRGRYDVVHAFSLTAELWTLLAGYVALRKPPMVSSVRGLYSTAPAWFWRIKRMVLRRSTAIIANASAAADVAAHLSNVPRRRFDVIANGVALPALPTQHESALLRRHVRAAIAAPQDRMMGLFVGRLVPEKNLACLLRAMARLPQAERPWIALAGDGPLRTELQFRIASMQLEGDIALLGERDDVADLTAAADFFVLPSSHEGMPNALMEAMASGCPAVASRVGGIPELLEHEANGLTFDSNDDAALAACLRRICSEPALRERLAGNARRLAGQRFSIDAMVAATSTVYERCLARLQETGARAAPDRPAASMLEKET